MTATIVSIVLRRPLAAAVAAALGLGLVPQIAAAEPSYALAMNGAPALPAGFDHFPYANPDAPKGGRLTYGVVGAFDSLNPFIVQGAATTARGIRDGVFGNLVFESLMARSQDEPYTLYGLIADTVDVPDDRSWVEFHLNPKARWSDGQPITVDDVIFSFNLIHEKGRPPARNYFNTVTSMESPGEGRVRINFADGSNRELPLLIAGSVPVLPKHAINPDTFDKSTLVPMIGSGPYVIDEAAAPGRIVFRRNRDYWAADLPSKRGFDNPDEIRIDYYRDANTLFEAFKAGLYDVNFEGDPSRWGSAYDFPDVTNGKVVREEITTGTPKGMRGLIFNTRRPQFADVRVRKAIADLFDFEWINQSIYQGYFSRNASYFQDSELSALGRPANDREKALLAPFPGVVAPAVMDGTYAPPKTDGSGNDRTALAAGLQEFRDAGYDIKDGKMVNLKTGAPLAFEFLIVNKDDEKLGVAFQRTLAKVGIDMQVRQVDSIAYETRRGTFDFDMMQFFWGASLSPGNEQYNRWGRAAADAKGSFNFPGVREPAVDAMIDAMVTARAHDDFVAAVRALDRVLVSGHYVVPLYYLPKSWIAYRSRLGHPEPALYGMQMETWWNKPGQ